jgi:hypothetical protein
MILASSVSLWLETRTFEKRVCTLTRPRLKRGRSKNAFVTRQGKFYSEQLQIEYLAPNSHHQKKQKNQCHLALLALG